METALKIDDSLQSRVQHLADQRHSSIQHIMLEAISQYVEREEARENFKQDALSSWAAYRENGRHLNAQEIREWLDTWGTEAEKTLPECHD